MPRLKNPKHEAFLKDVIKGSPIQEAYKKQYPKANKNTIQAEPYHLLKREDIANRFIQLLNNNDKLKDEVVINKLAEQLCAETPLTFKGKRTGESIPNYPVQINAIKLILQAKGVLNDGSINVNNQYNQQNNYMIEEFSGRFDKIVSMFDQLSGKIDIDSSKNIKKPAINNDTIEISINDNDTIEVSIDPQ